MILPLLDNRVFKFVLDINMSMIIWLVIHSCIVCIKFHILYKHAVYQIIQNPGGSMSQVVGLLNNSYKPITNTAWVRAWLCKLQKGCTRIASDKVYQLLTHGRCFSPGTPDSSTTKTGRHDTAEILLKVALTTINQIKSSITNLYIKVDIMIMMT